jgi:hypothetical protein
MLGHVKCYEEKSAKMESERVAVVLLDKMARKHLFVVMVYNKT